MHSNAHKAILTVLKGGVGGEPFSPSDIAGLKLWLKADAITGLSDGDAVTTWSDSSGQGNNAGQGTASKKPTYKTAIKNGLAIVRFDGTDDFMDLATDLFNTNVPKTVFVVATVSSTNGLLIGDVGYDGYWSGGQYSQGVMVYGGNAQMMHRSASNGVYITGGAASAWTIISAIFADGATSYLYQDGAQKGTSTNALASFYTSTSIGGNGSFASTLANGDFAEIIYYDSALSLADYGSVQTYLNNKWAVY